MIKEVKNKELGIVIQSLITEKSIEEISIAFVDDTNFITNEEDYQIKM